VQAAAAELKAQLGVPWQQMLLVTPADAQSAASVARTLGMAAVSVSSPATGLDVGTLRQGLGVYAAKLEGDRGY
jgi:hypothetical protein